MPKIVIQTENVIFNGLIQVLQNPGVNASRNLLLKASSRTKCHENLIYIYL